ncbi:MAG: GtrA family protein [Solobacterium sp.]|nr:GtrA family protein [Solobacterium sp.]
MKELLLRNKHVILYVVFGALTTAVNIVSYWLMSRFLHLSVEISTAAAWVLSVLFAYVTNRTWVFESRAKGTEAIAKEIVSFFLSRLSTGVLDWLIMFVFVTKLSLPDMPVKLASNVIVIVLNYILSRFLVFRKTEDSE